jgi:MYXO-CTERM domain-containing protein
MIASRRPLRPLLLSLTVIGSLAAILVPTAARAESAVAPPRCRVQLLPSGTGVPGNLPALVVDDTGTSSGLTAGVEGVTVTGGSVPVKLGVVPDPKTPSVLLLVPSTNDLFEAGTRYDISYTMKCSAAVLVTPGTSSFTAGAAATLPTSIGTASELENGNVTITPSPELKAFQATTRFEASIDGVAIGTTRYGQVISETLDLSLGGYGLSFSGAASPLSAPKLCTTTAFERHSVKLVAHVAGAQDDTAPLTFSMGIDCAKAAAQSPSLPDAGADDRGASGGSDGGCAVGGSDPFGSVAGLFGLGAGLAVTLRRRRRGARAHRD